MFQNFELVKKISLFISIIDLILGIFGLIYYSKLSFFSKDFEHDSSIKNVTQEEIIGVKDEDNNAFLLFIIISMLACISFVDTVCSIVLSIGIKKQNLKKCLIWFYTRIVSFSINSLVFGIFLIINQGDSIVLTTITALLTLYHLFGLWFVNFLIGHLKRKKNRLRNVPKIMIIDDLGNAKSASTISLQNAVLKDEHDNK